MPSFMDSDSVAANTLSTNLLAGELIEFLDDNFVINAGWTISATGLRVTFSAGPRILCQDLLPVVKTTAPVFPDDLQVSEIGMAGERLIVRANNSTAGALTLLARYQLDVIA